ncbi:MAG: sulfurtransferase TusA family protein [Nitrospirae bacterium]|nr:sulfurtransferase TusA family protein [Candidatus Manganitrophaceae bacterium]
MTKADFSLDTLGMFCPIPVILTSKKMKEMVSGQIIEVLSDDPGIKKDMPVWCKNTGNTLLSLNEADGVITIYLRKKP